MPREDIYTNTPEDADLFELHYGPQYDDDRPTRDELDREEAEHDLAFPDGDPTDEEISAWTTAWAAGDDPWSVPGVEIEPPF